MNKIELTAETKQLIRKAIRERLAGKATEYRIRKVIKAELEEPQSWWNPSDDEDDNPNVSAIERYYRNINNATYAPGIFQSFSDRLLIKYGIAV